eukprot:m.305583 g.305583  ORF g.305583 m.305583 type:complete len:73 (-) comp15909_c4_seq4:181-399(-)
MKAPSHGTPLGEPCARNLQDGSTCSPLQNRTRTGNVSLFDVLHSMIAGIDTHDTSPTTCRQTPFDINMLATL